MCRPVFAMLALALTGIAEAQSGSRRGYATTSLPSGTLEHRFVRLGDAILIEDVMVNGKGPFRFMLDTGAEGAGRVDAAFVEALQLPATGTSTGTGPLGEERNMTRHRVDSLAIGGLTFTGLDLSSRDYNAEITDAGFRPIHGILGFHLFSEYLLTINYPARTITVKKGELPPPDGKSVLSMISPDEDPEIEVTIGGQTAQALLDTGAMCNLALPTSFADTLKFTAEPVVRGRESGAELRSATLDGALRIGAVEITNPDVLIAGPVIQPIIGIRIIAALSLTFDQKNARVCVERPAERKRYGFSWRGTEFKGVTPGSIAEAAGLRSSDTIVSINGLILAEMDREELLKQLDASAVTLGIERDGRRLEIRMSLD